MTQAFNLAILANAVDTSGKLNVGTNAVGTLPVANGGSGAATLAANNVLLGNGTSALQAVAPSTNGNYLRSNGTTWVSQAGATGTVSSVATGNGLSGGTITTTGTLVVACPGFNTVGSYSMVGSGYVNGQTYSAGSNYGIGNGDTLIACAAARDAAPYGGGAGFDYSFAISGTWKWMGASATMSITSGNAVVVGCRVA